MAVGLCDEVVAEAAHGQVVGGGSTAGASGTRRREGSTASRGMD